MAFWKRWMDLPTVIRLIDPPLHEFLPPFEELLDRCYETARANSLYGARERRFHIPKEELAEKEDLLHAVESLPRSESDARLARLSFGHHDARNYQDAGAGDF